MWLVVQTLVMRSEGVPNVFFCVPLKVLATSLSLQVFLNSFSLRKKEQTPKQNTM